jgi:hypothetical protein
MRHLVPTIIIGLAGLAFAGPATAGDTRRQPTKDPNEKVCEDIGTVGSRLKVTRVCATRAEWVERRKQDRQDIERVQSMGGSRCVQIKNAASTAPVC